MKKMVGVLGVLIATAYALHAQNFCWVKRFGGTEATTCQSLTTDSEGNILVTGYFDGTTDMDPGPGVLNFTVGGNSDAYIAKLDSNGGLIWAREINSISHSGNTVFGVRVAVDDLNNVYVTGSLNGTADFNPGIGIFNLTSSVSGCDDLFILKLSASGDFIWAKLMGSPECDYVYSFAADAAANIYIAGSMYNKIYIAKLDSASNPIWAYNFGPSAFHTANSVTVSATGDVYVTGYFKQTVIFPSGTGTFTSRGGADIFIAKISKTGQFRWTRAMGGLGSDYSGTLVSDSSGNVYTTGQFEGTVDFDPGSGIYNMTGANGDVFLSKLDTAGNFVWAKQVGGSLDDRGLSIAIDLAGDIYVSGIFESTADFDPDAGTFNLTSAGNGDKFIAKYHDSGAFVWAERIGNTNEDYYVGVHVTAPGEVLAVGYFQYTVDFDPGPGIENLTATTGTYYDGFILRLSDRLTISGRILTGTGSPVAGVKMLVTGSVTYSVWSGSYGQYILKVPAGGNYTITPSKNNDSIPNNGITTSDLLLMRRHTLGITPLSSPYKIIAAAECNADGDTTVTGLDILRVRELILGNSTAFPTNRRWQFVSSNYVFPNASNPFPFDKTRTYINVTSNHTNQNYIGIKLGDLNNSWNPGIH